MYDTLTVRISASLDQLAQVVAHFRFRQRLPVLEDVHERLRGHRINTIVRIGGIFGGCISPIH